ncbi:methyltransferase domain-containing protein [Anabaena sp. CCY 9910]|uniref:class I SAM-dependent methyltransferase n=1 Tax=Anabaena sp. CCY 9910 TaxID=3103870 RepID=UPI0039DF620A
MKARNSKFANSQNTNIQVKFAKLIMKRFGNFPISPDIYVGELEEVFNHSIFVNGTHHKRKEIMLHSSQSSYESEKAYSLCNYFGKDLTPYLENKNVLDLGCFNGGRGIAWFEKFNMASITGIDVKHEYIDAAMQFAGLKNINAKYLLAKGEELPFADKTFDAIVAFNVMEHLQNVEKTLIQCDRVLGSNGVLCVVFPGYYHPTGHHLDLVTKIPFIHYLFKGEILMQAYYEILQERGEEAHWYYRHSSELKSWEKCNTINGTTVAKFQKIIKTQNWQIVLKTCKPIGNVGRNISQNEIINLASILLYPLASMPILQELFLHRITYILRKHTDEK